MTAPGVRLVRAALVPVLLLGAAACAPLFDRPKQVEIRPIETPSADGAAADDNAYRSATRAIDDRDYALALEYLQAARERQPHDVRVLNAFGVVYDKLGRFDLSARYYAQAKAVEPHSAIVLANMAYSRALQGLTKDEPVANGLADANPASSTPVAAQLAARPTIKSGDVGLRVLPSAENPAQDLAQLPRQAALRTAPEALQIRTGGLSAAQPLPAAGTLPETVSTPTIQQVPVWAGAPALASQSPPVHTATAQKADLRPTAEFESTAPIAKAAISSGLVVANAAIRMPLLTGHPLIIVNASGRKRATDAMRRRLVHLGWTAPRWAAREGADREHTTLFYARPHSAAARALAHTLRFPVHLAGRSCDCGGLELVVGKDFLRSGTLAANVESGQDDPVNAGKAAIPTLSKEHHHVPAKA